MDSKTEPASEAKERIEKYAEVHGADQTYEFQAKRSYIAGATAEYNLAQEEITRLKAELEREREFRKELVDCLEVHQTKWISAEHYWGSDTNEWAESLIEKSKN